MGSWIASVAIVCAAGFIVHRYGASMRKWSDRVYKWFEGRIRDDRRSGLQQLGFSKAPANRWLCSMAERLYETGEPVQMLASSLRLRPVSLLEYGLPGRQQKNGRDSDLPIVHLLAVTLPVALPPLVVTRDSKLKRFVNDQDFLTDSVAFNDAFHVRCEDEQYGWSVLHPDMTSWLLQFPDMEWQVSGNSLITWASGEFVLDTVVRQMHALSGVADRLPHAVLQVYGRPASGIV